MATLNTSSWTNLSRWIVTPSALGYSLGYAVQGKILAQDNVSNKSTVSFQLVAWIVEKASARNAYSQYTQYITMALNGTTLISSKSFTTGSSGSTLNGYTESAPRTLSSWSTTVDHDTDGAYSKAYSLSARVWGSGGFNVTASGSLDLPSLPRLSTIASVDSITMGSSTPVTVTPAVSSYYDILSYSTNGSTYAELARGQGTLSANWPVPDTTAAVTSSDRTTYYLKAVAYTDVYATAIGTTIKNVTAVVPASVVPSLAVGSITEGNTAIPSGWPFINGYSKPSVPITFTGAQGSTKAGSSAVFGSASASEASASSPVSLIVGPVATGSGTASVIDSRGRSASATVSIALSAYAKPTLALDVTRCESDGTPSSAGEYAKVKAKWTFTDVNSLNTSAITIYKDGVQAAAFTPTAYTQTDLVQIALLSDISTTAAYTISATIADQIATATASAVVPKSNIPLSLHDDGSAIGVAIGRSYNESTAGALQINGDMKLISSGLYAVNGGNSATLTADELIAKLNSSGTDVESKDIAYSGMTSGVTVNWLKAYKTGKVVTIYAKFSKSAATASGSNALTCSLTNMSGWLPPLDVEAFSYYAAVGLGMRLEPDGSVTVRNASPSAKTLADGFQFSLTYVLA